MKLEHPEWNQCAPRLWGCKNCGRDLPAFSDDETCSICQRQEMLAATEDADRRLEMQWMEEEGL
jgi:hypothetical protein